MRMAFSNRSRKNTRDQKKIASKGRSSRKLRSFENSASQRLKVPGKKVNSNGHNSGLGGPFQSIFFLKLRIFSISTQPNSRKAVLARGFFRKRLLLIQIWRKSKKEIQWEVMSFSNRSRKNTRDQKKNCAEKTFESEVTTIRKKLLKIEGSRELRKFQTAITRASDVRFSRFFFW